ncbi:MAG: flagellar basal body rod protein FlgC [Phenylobacterium sp.]|uniref:flagellar basal body rod protein FlgC n=1 Tax=Phenylobacterium sp. TaxID=1871053 RepID=UPI001A5AA55D|nr:flagellar basal body rod protein FlgC [Phenylobacterium sp.]MBL8555553.1 flagellar basal body rod protein FlgC [Phenylobacterium sp.]
MPEIKPTAGVAQAIAASALRAQQARMRIIAENLANADSTSKTAGGDPYRRQEPIFEPVKVAGAKGVRMSKVEPDQSDFRQEYDPGHPSADAKGYVKLPNVNSMVEALDMRAAQRAYEANLNVIETSRQMDLRTLDLLKK